MPRQPNRSTSRPATTTRAGSNTAHRPNGNGNGKRNNRAAYWPMELSLTGGLELVVEGQNGDSFGIAVCALCGSILPGSEQSQRIHSIWHETIARIHDR